MWVLRLRDWQPDESGDGNRCLCDHLQRTRPTIALSRFSRLLRQTRPGKPMQRNWPKDRRGLQPTPPARQPTNMTNGDIFRWNQLWKRIAQHLDMDPGEPMPISLSQMMADKGPLWEKIKKKTRAGRRSLRQDRRMGIWGFHFQLQLGRDLFNHAHPASRFYRGR